MDINQLQLFEQVVQQGSFDRVATENYVSQRAVSQQIKRLEEELNVELFERHSNRIKLTPAGLYFAQRTQEYLDNLSDTINSLQKMKNSDLLQLKMAYFSVFDGVLLRDQILNYKKENLKPNILFTTAEESVEHILADLALKKIDCGYINHYGKYHFINRNLYDFLDVYKGEMVLGISKLNLLCKKRKITEADLAGQNILYYSNESSDYMKDTFLATLNSQISKYHIKRESSIEKMMIDCSLNDGVAYVTEGLFEKFMVHDKNIVFRHIKSQKIDQTYNMQLVFRKDNKSKALKSFIGSIKKE